jgi:hypothetical protein
MAHHEDSLFELLQSKRAEAVDTNEDDSTVGTTHLYEDEPEQPKPLQEVNHQSTGVWEGHKKTRQGVLDTVFDGRSKADSADQKLIAQNFAHGKSGDFTSHSVHLQGKSEEKVSHPRTPTLMAQVLKVAGRL